MRAGSLSTPVMEHAKVRRKTINGTELHAPHALAALPIVGNSATAQHYDGADAGSFTPQHYCI